MPGFGDEITWPPCDGHPMDPRTPDLDWPLDEWTAEELATRIALRFDFYPDGWSIAD